MWSPPVHGVGGRNAGTPHHSLMRVEVWALHLAFAGVVRFGAGCLFVFLLFVWNKEVFSESFQSCYVVPFVVLWLGEQVFVGAFVVCDPWHLLASSGPSLGYMRQKVNPGTYHCIIPCVPTSLTDQLSSPHFSEASYIVLYTISRDFRGI